MKYSIILPVYGVEKYLDQCVESVLAQTFSDFEVILVDDKSPDNCPAMCDAWADKDSRIKVVHKEQNGGLGFARNTGMEYAQGEYILFIDSDDYISENLLAECDRALTAETDMLVFGVEYVYQDKTGKTTLTEQALPEPFCADTAQKRAELFAMLNRCRAFPFAWNKIYRRGFLQEAGTLFEKTKLIEDFLFNIDLFGKAKRIDALDRALYCYRKPAHETLASRYSPEFFDLCKRRYLLQEDFLRSCDALNGHPQELIHQDYLKHMISVLLKNHSKSSGLTYKQQKAAAVAVAADPVTVRVVEQMRPAGLRFKVIHFALKHRMAGSLLFFCGVIAFIQQRLMPLYRKLA